MRIDIVTLREIRMRLRAPFETSFGSVQDRRLLLVEIQSEGLSGWGEVTAMEGPFYNAETTDTAWLILRGFLIPSVLGKHFESASDMAAAMAPVRGHEMAKAALENAVWDIEAQSKGISLGRLLGGTLTEIPCGVSLGIQPAIDTLLPIVERELAAGYRRIKLKIKPGKDVAVVAAVRRRYPEITLSVDANSAYSLEDIEHLKKLDEFGLLMIEQPLQWDEVYYHSKLQAQLTTPICLDESIYNVRHASAAIEMGACRVVNIKLGRVGGHTEARRMQAMCAAKAIPVWCGGMMESGIGRVHNIAMSTQAGFIWPGDVSASRRYWEEDIIDPEVTVSSQGTIGAPQSPGLGYAVRTKRIEQLTVTREVLSDTAATVSVAG